MCGLIVLAKVKVETEHDHEASPAKRQKVESSDICDYEQARLAKVEVQSSFAKT